MVRFPVQFWKVALHRKRASQIPGLRYLFPLFVLAACTQHPIDRWGVLFTPKCAAYRMETVSSPVVYRGWKQGQTALREAKMLNDLLFVATIFVTRIVLPIALTLFLGCHLERRLNPARPG